MKFNSQICTTKEQSARLLALGIKKETADCSWNTVTLHGTLVTYPSQDSWTEYPIISDNHFPAWSLHRLIELLGLSKICLNIDIYDSLYEEVIRRIEIFINSGEFNKEYLEV